MNENQNRQNNLVDTTDCLEAVGVCRGWKNFLLIIVALCLFLLQVSFWLVNTGYIKAEAVETTLAGTLSAFGGPASTPPLAIEEAAEKAVARKPAGSEEQTPQSQQRHFLFEIKMKHLSLVIRFCNFLLVLAAMLYCLTILFSFKVSLIGRLGGINHICRAFFLSLVMVILLLPWQNLFGNIVAGAIYTPDELVKWCTAESNNIFATIVHYLRFTGYWLLIVLLLILSHLRSSRWTRAILRRLEVL